MNPWGIRKDLLVARAASCTINRYINPPILQFLRYLFWTVEIEIEMNLHSYCFRV